MPSGCTRTVPGTCRVNKDDEQDVRATQRVPVSLREDPRTTTLVESGDQRRVLEARIALWLIVVSRGPVEIAAELFHAAAPSLVAVRGPSAHTGSLRNQYKDT